MFNLLKIKEFALNILYPKHLACIFCDEELDDSASNDTCYECLYSLPFIQEGCARCGAKTADNNDGICLNCKANNFNYDLARSVFAYKNDVVNAVHKFKYSSHKYLYEPFGNFLSKYLAMWNISPDFITSVPLHKNKEIERGFNQSKLMAEIVSKNFAIPYIDICEKIVDNSNQAKLSLKERRENVKDSYKSIPKINKIIRDKTILLIDDVYTTGSTVSEVSKIIKYAGAKTVYVLTLAHAIDQQEL